MDELRKTVLEMLWKKQGFTMGFTETTAAFTDGYEAALEWVVEQIDQLAVSDEAQ